jgi:murein tripeptide amidase MpaA
LLIIRKKAESSYGVRLDVDLTHESLSGLEIPVIKLHHGQPGNGKFCAFILGRQHPGESNGSHVLSGSLQQLLSADEESVKLLKYCDFVVIPMLNPDGVVSGNFRTSLFGKDLNRLFKAKDTTLLPEIETARTVFSNCSETYKRKLLLFLDYHGHSTRKNAFFLGPGIFDAQLLNDIRILPKIIASQTEIFRYPSCSFRLE